MFFLPFTWLARIFATYLSDLFSAIANFPLSETNVQQDGQESVAALKLQFLLNSFISTENLHKLVLLNPEAKVFELQWPEGCPKFSKIPKNPDINFFSLFS